MISVIIPYLSGLKELKDCISSINKQGVNEIIVVNDSEEHLDLLGVKIIDNKKTKGAAYSRNVGFQNASNELVLFVDHDIIIDDNSITKLKNKIKNVDIVFPKVIYENNKLMHPVGREKTFPQISACFMVKKSSVKKMDCLFDENYHIYLEDADFFLRANLFNLKIAYVPDAVVVHKLKHSTNEKRFFLENKNLLYGIIKFSNINKQNILHPFHFSSYFSNFICALFNFDKFDWSHYNRDLNSLKKFKLLFKKHRKITNRNRFILLGQFIKATFWVLFHQNKPLQAKKRLQRYLQ
ncbi:glycosyltransferase [archaeon]|nr:glycosyltransferase [archaeon]MBL7057354.1 glycosyltransferase [Candidatus Woesearchaeota archaeon]